MKKFISIFLILFANIYLYSQETWVGLPKENNGYLLLNNAEYPGVSKWEIDISELSFNNGNKIVSNLVTYTTTTNYAFLTQLNSTSSKYYRLNIRGYNESNDLIISQNNIATSVNEIDLDIEYAAFGDLPDLKCKENCNGKTYNGYLFPYSYDIVMYEYPNGGSFFYVQDAYYDDGSGYSTPYYAYYEVLNYLSWCSNLQCVYGNPNQNGRIIKEIDGNAGNFKDIQGHPLQGTLVAVQKDAGPWGEGAGLRAPALTPPPANINQSTLTLQAQSSCGNGLNYFMNIMTNYGDYNPSPNISFPQMVCIPAQNTVPGSGGVNHGWTLSWLKNREDQIFDNLNNGGGGIRPIPSPVNGGNFWEIIAELEDESEINQNGILDDNEQVLTALGGIGSNISEIISQIIIFDQANNLEIEKISLNQLFSEDGGLNIESHSLPSSLYSVSIIFQNGQIITRTIEASSGIDLTFDYSDFFNVTAYPAPISNGTFQLQLEGQINSTWHYDLLDFDGNIIYQGDRNFDYQINNGVENYQFSLNLSSLQSGSIVFHRCTFEDGSVITIETTIE